MISSSAGSRTQPGAPQATWRFYRDV